MLLEGLRVGRGVFYGILFILGLRWGFVWGGSCFFCNFVGFGIFEIFGGLKSFCIRFFLYLEFF